MTRMRFLGRFEEFFSFLFFLFFRVFSCFWLGFRDGWVSWWRWLCGMGSEPSGLSSIVGFV